MAEAEERDKIKAKIEHDCYFNRKPEPKIFRPKKFIELEGTEGKVYLNRDRIEAVVKKGEARTVIVVSGELAGYDVCTPAVLVAAVLNNEIETVFQMNPGEEDITE